MPYIRNLLIAGLGLLALGGCVSLPPRAYSQKSPSSALDHPENTRLGKHFESVARDGGGNSGFRMISAGVDGLLMRLEMINATESTLDLQYYIFHADETGRLVADALVHAADRGVRVRILMDDGETVAGDETLLMLSAHPSIQVRVFNPFEYRGHNPFLRGVEFVLRHSQVDYRMHNKLIVADNALALTGGRNIGDQYFQVDPESQFGDDDIVVAGPLVKQLSAEYDEYWNSRLTVPAETLAGKKLSDAEFAKFREKLGAHRTDLKAADVDYLKRASLGEPFLGILSGKSPLVWSPARLVYDSPEKKRVKDGVAFGRLIYTPIAKEIESVKSELLLVTPYFIPAPEELKLLEKERDQNVHVRLLTNSLVATPDLVAHAGYMHHRVALLKDGVAVYEVRALLGSSKGSGETKKLTRHGNYGLHAKLFVFDRKKIFVGSMNFDQRSLRLNTEMGLIIDNAQLAQEAAQRFEALAQPQNAYQVALVDAAKQRSQLVWKTQEGDRAVEYRVEPARSRWQRFKVRVLTVLPLDQEL